MSSGTSYSAAEVSGIVALMLQRKPELTRNILRVTARDIGPRGPDAMFGAGLADAYGAVTAEPAPATAAGSRPIERVYRRALTRRLVKPLPHRDKVATCCVSPALRRRNDFN